MLSRMFDLPVPLRPLRVQHYTMTALTDVMALKDESHPLITVRTEYDLKPSLTISSSRMIGRRRSSVPQNC